MIYASRHEAVASGPGAKQHRRRCQESAWRFEFARRRTNGAGPCGQRFSSSGFTMAADFPRVSCDWCSACMGNSATQPHDAVFCKRGNAATPA